jgi:GNAT superfamily N-acetyltransferase
MSGEPQRPASVEARVAAEGDVPAIAGTMAAAFYDDPVWGWAFADPEGRLEQHRAVWGFVIASARRHGWVWVTEDSTTAAVWIPPGLPELSPDEGARLFALVRELLGDGAARVLETFDRFEEAQPIGSYYYLSLLATHPDRRGRGLGMALLADNLARIDAEGRPAYLESSNPANDHRYERLGFARMGEFELGEDGPTVTQMWRDPR